MIIWVIAGLLGMATGLRIGWGLVNQQSVVSSAMIVALGGLAVVAAVNWPPLTLLIDTALQWPNIAIGLSQVALIASAAGSCVMITSVASTRNPSTTRRLAVFQYSVAALIAAVTLVLFFARGRELEMAPREYLDRNLGSGTLALSWLIPLLYVVLALTLVHELADCPTVFIADAFLRFGYARLLDARAPRYHAMARWGVTVTAGQVEAARNPAAFDAMIASAIDRAAHALM